jgi:DNA-directed RNA polymerase alpha subunit
MKKKSLPTELTHLNLSTRVYNGLYRAGITSIEKLREKSWNDLLEVRELGRGSAAEAFQALLYYEGSTK